jgi:hypothetical protein
MPMKSTTLKNDECRMTNGISGCFRSIRHPAFVIQLENQRFVACAESPRWLIINVRTATRAPVSKSGSQFHLSAGCNSRDRFQSVSQKSDRHNLTRCEIFRGKVPPRKTQKPKTASKTRTHLRQIYE